MLQVDTRGLHPPEPLRRTLAALDGLAPGQELEAWFDRRPLLLMPMLGLKGLKWTESRSGASVRLVIRRA